MRTSRRDPWLGALLALLLLRLALLAPHLVVADLDFEYPFAGGDSHDWIANGLTLAGHDVRYSGRPPLVPAVLALLERLGALGWFPLLLQLAAAGSLVLLYLVLRRAGSHQGGSRSAGSRRVAFAVTVILALNYSFQSLALEVMADVPAAGLLFAALALTAAAGSRPRLWPAAGLAGGLSYLTQGTALLFPVPVAALLLVRRRDHLRRPESWAGAALFALGAALFALFPLGWALARRLLLGAWGDTLVRQWGLLRFHLDAAGPYLWAAVSFFGLPLAAAVLYGAVRALRCTLREAPGPETAPGPAFAADLRLLALVHAAAVACFFVFLYDFQAKRFLLYLFLPAGVFLAEALAQVRRPALFWGLAAVLAGWSLFPHTVRGADPREVPLWPWPRLVLAAQVEISPHGAVSARPATAQLVRRRGGLLADSVFARLHRPRPGAVPKLAPPRPAPGAFAADRGALLLHAPSASGRRYREAGRLGNALRKRVKYLPAGLLDPWWGWLDAEPLGRLYGYRASRVRPPGLEGTWLVLSQVPEPEPAGEGCPPLSEEAAAAALAEARGIARLVAERRLPVAVVPPLRPACDSSLLYLPFVVETTEMFVLAASLAGDTVIGEEAVGRARLRFLDLATGPAAEVTWRE